EDPGQGVFMLTACSPTEIARGDVARGHGAFTGHVIKGMKEEALAHFPDKGSKDKGRSLLTVRKLAAYISEKMQNDFQTPMLFRKRGADQSRDLCITEMTLPVPPDKVEVEPAPQFQYIEKLSLLDSLGPAYFLNDDFYFVDWNAAFESLIAAPHKLRRGQP